jgi:rubrerythrin
LFPPDFFPIPRPFLTFFSSAGPLPFTPFDLLREHEKAIGRLYETYAHRFPQDREFWLTLAQEEDQHARWIELLQRKVEEDPSAMVVNRFPAAAINHSLHYISRLMEGAQQPGLTPINALSAALDIEQALLENKYFEVFASESAGIQNLLHLLAQATRAHIEKVRSALHNHTAGPN